MKTLYFECFSGISGDMTVGALLDLIVPFDYLKNNLLKLGIDDEYEIEAKKEIKNGIEGTSFYVYLNEKKEDDEHHGRNLLDIETLIDSSELNENVKNISKGIFKIVADAESRVHGCGIYDVHFHEVGAVDSIIDIVSTAICIDYIKPDRVISSPINTGKGFVKCQHGIMPVPAPATVKILSGVKVYCDDREMELTTPTGAAIIKYLAKDFGNYPQMRIKKEGYGCGKRNTEKPNVLRVILFEDEFEKKDSENCILEATIDDMNPQIYGYIMDKLFDEGALDVYLTPVYMKKNRPGTVITITAPADIQDKIIKLLFKETTTIGIRKFNIDRFELDRKIESLNTDYGKIRFKVSNYKGNVVNVSPEYEDVKKASVNYKVPFKIAYYNAVKYGQNLFEK